MTGDQYDHFNVQFTYPNGGINDSMCRQIDGCANEVSDWSWGRRATRIARTRSLTLPARWCGNIRKPGQEPGKTQFNPYDQEHVDFVNAIRTNQPINEAEHLAHSTLIAILGRTAAYTGKEVKWDEMMDSNERLGPTEYAMGPVRHQGGSAGARKCREHRQERTGSLAPPNSDPRFMSPKGASRSSPGQRPGIHGN